jgi:hypothetical protein
MASMGSTGARGTTVWLWLTAPIAVLLAIAAGSELLVDGIFRGDDVTLVAQTVGFDSVTLAVALPGLLASAILARRGSDRARLVWFGALAYVLYTYAIYAFHVRFNPLFLVYVALLGLSLYALTGGLATMDFAALRARFAIRTPVRATSLFLAAVTVLFSVVSLREIIPALLAGGVPRSVADAGTPTGSPHVLDLAWMLPAMGLTAVWLWRGRPLAYALAGALLAFLSLMTLAIGAMMVAVYVYGEPVAPGTGAVFGVFSAASAGMLAWYLKYLEGGRRLLSDSAPNVVGAGDIDWPLEGPGQASAPERDALHREIVRKGASS